MSHYINQVNGAFIFPSTDGTANQVMKTDGSGQLSWTDQSGGGGSLPDVNTESSVPGSGTYTIALADLTNQEVTFLFNYSGGSSINVELPAIEDGGGSTQISSGYKVNLKRLGTDPITVIVSSGSGDLIDNSGSLSLPYRYSSVTLQSDGANRWVI